MRTAILVVHFPPRWTAGTELASLHLATELTQRGHEVHVFTTWDKGLPIVEDMRGFRVHRIPFEGRMPVAGSLLYLLRILEELKEISPDVIQTQSISLGWMGAMAGKILNIPHVTYGRGSDIYTKWRFKGTLLRYNLRTADAVLALTGDMRDRIHELSNCQVTVIPNGLEVDDFRTITPISREELGIRSGSKMVISLGTLRAVKGVEHLIDAMSLVIEKYPETALVIVGDGGERNRLENRVSLLGLEKVVKFTGRVSNADVPRYLCAADVFALPSLSEGFPNVALEAMAAGLPIVCTEVGGLPTIVQEGVNGFLVGPKDPKAIADRICRLLGDDTLRGGICMNNRQKACEYSWKETARMIESVYFDVCKSARTKTYHRSS